MIRVIFSTALFISVVGCGQKSDDRLNNVETDLMYLLLRRSGTMDTTYRQLLENSRVDSFFIVSYLEKAVGKTVFDSATYRLPNWSDSADFQHIRLIKKKGFTFEGKEYMVYKYLFDDPEVDDEEMLCFYSHDFGLILLRSAWWGNYERLVNTGDPEKDNIIFYLNEMVANDDKEFLFDW